MRLKPIVLAVAAAACASVAHSQGNPLKVAMIEALSGPAASTGIATTEGVRYGVMKINAAGGFNGAKVQLIEYDNQGGVNGAAEKLKIAIADGARIVSSASSSAIAAQLSEDIRKYNLRNPGKELIYVNMSEAFELTAEKCHFWYFRLATNPYIRMAALVRVMNDAGTLGRQVFSINQNYSYGVDMQTAQANAVAKTQSKIVEAVLHDTNKIQDFSPYVAKIKASGADTVLTGNWANDIVYLLKAAGDTGLKARFGATTLDTPGTLSNAGAAALGSYNVKGYAMEAGGEAGKVFVEDFKSKMGHYPWSEESTSYFAFATLGAALASVDFKGGSIDAKKLALALEAASFESPAGKWSVRKDDHQVLLPVVVTQVSKEAIYKADGTDMGFRLVKVVNAQDSAVPVSSACKMQRPVD